MHNRRGVIYKIIISVFLILFLGFGFWLYQIKSRYYMIAKFSESGPLYMNMPVFFRGYRIGQVKEIKLSEDYKYSLVKIVLYPKKPLLSEDIVAKVKKNTIRKEYIELLTPDQASEIHLKDGSTIDGEAAFDMEAFLSDIADSDLIVPLLQTFTDTLVSLDKTSVEIKGFFSDSRIILDDNRQNLKQTTKDLATTTKSLKKISTRFNKSFTEEKINNTTTSIDKASTNIVTVTENAKKITENIDKATKNIDKTVSNIDCAISKTNNIADDVKVITGGLRESLGKRFAGLKIIFGKPVNENECSRNCYK